MNNVIYRLEKPANEPVKAYTPGSPEQISLLSRIREMKSREIDIPIIINGKEIRTGNTGTCVCPHEHAKTLAVYHKAGPDEIRLAIDAVMNAKKNWTAISWADRMAIFRKMADLLAGPFRDLINSATILNQSKNIFQAEIDSACETIDFLRFNTYYAAQIYLDQPGSGPTIWNQTEYRPLEGFILAVSPFNFTSIASNLATSPAIMGNTVIWKPASTAVYSGYFLMQLYKEAGLPDGVINFLPGSGSEIADTVLASPDFAGVHFTGSTTVFRGIWRKIGNQIETFKSYPRIVGETGGKNFLFVHPSAQIKATVVAIVRGAFEYQGQKCSAASRVYVPKSFWRKLREPLLDTISELKMGSPEDHRNFMNAVIDKHAFDSIVAYIDYVPKSQEAEIICGGKYDDSVGYFIEPTVILTQNPQFRTMVEEIFGPVVTIYLYDDDMFEKTLVLCNNTSPYGLTGTIMATDRHAIVKAKEILIHAAGNFYINDKPTGAVVGQQPFGGSRASGTNDKAGSAVNLLRWVSPRTIKENFLPPEDYRYPFMGDDDRVNREK